MNLGNPPGPSANRGGSQNCVQTHSIAAATGLTSADLAALEARWIDRTLAEQALLAGVDVTDPEPLPRGHPLWKFNNVIITPHVAGSSDKVGERIVDTMRENIARFVDGKPLINVVDKQKGY